MDPELPAGPGGGGGGGAGAVGGPASVLGPPFSVPAVSGREGRAGVVAERSAAAKACCHPVELPVE